MAYTPRGKENDSPPVDCLDDGNIESDFGDAKYVTDDMLIRFNRNIRFNKDKIELLEDKTDPELRKNLSPLSQNEQDSYGMDYDTGRNVWEVSDSEEYHRNDHFLSIENVDLKLTTAYIDTASGNVEVPKTIGAEVINTHCEGPWGAYRCNTHWYVGYKRDENYWASPDWMADPKNADMPTVLRSQVFTAEADGRISKVTLDIERSIHAEDKLTLEIRNVVNHKPGDTIIASVTLDMDQYVKGGLVAFPFKELPIVVNGQEYCWVLRSPFTSYRNHYGVGGWGKNCNADPYSGGNAFTSYDNGQTWLEHGRDEDIPYYEGMYAPQDFCFIVHTVPVTTYRVNTDFWLYLNVVRTNPIKAVTLANSQTLNGQTIVLEVSKDFDTWNEANAGNGWMIQYSPPYPTRVWVRAKLRTNNNAATPRLDQLNIVCDCDPALSGVLKTELFTPRYDDPLGASIWSKIHAPVTTVPTDDPENPEVDVSVDIVRSMISEEFIEVDETTVTVTLAKPAAEPLMYVRINVNGVITELIEYRDFTVDYSGALPVLTIDPGKIVGASILMVSYYELWLRDIPQSMFPLKTDLFDEIFTTNGTDKTFKLSVSPCEPLREVFLDGDQIFEGTDFDVNYLTNVLTLRVLPDTGLELEVKYTPNLSDKSLSLIYRVTRPDTNWNVEIEPPYFEVRV